MATAVAHLPLLEARVKLRRHARRQEFRFPLETVILFTLALAFYIAVASYFVFHVHYMVNDAYARIDNAFDVLFTRDPHLAAIGFVWPPLPSFLDLPIIAFKGIWPALVNQGFAGSIEAAIFGAGTVVLFNSGLKWAGVVRGMRWLFCAAWAINPMIVVYSIQGMSELPFVFFAVASMFVFLRWCESRRGALLPLLGIVAGLGCLCRVEMFLLTFFIGVGVVLRSYRWRVSWREIETQALMYALPALLMIGLWVGTTAVIFRDPLYIIHAQAGPTAPGGNVTPGGGALPGGVIAIHTWQGAATFIISHSLDLFPAVIAAFGVLAVRILLKKDRLTGLMLVSFAVPIAALDIYLIHSGGLSTTLRYQIFVIPYTFVVFVYVLRSLRSRIPIFSTMIALGMVAVLGLSNITTAETIGNPALSQDEYAAVTALATGKTMEQITGGTAIDIGMALAPRVEALDTDHGLIACDSTTCFPIILNVKNPKMFVVTSDRDFQGVVAQPQVYHVEYFLVQNNIRDELNRTYPGLYEDGGGFAVRVGDIGEGWRLYRITGPTGRG